MKRFLVLALAFTVVAMPWRAHAAGQPDDVSSKIDAYMDAVAKTGHFMGSILVARGGRVIIAKGYGMADVPAQTPNTPDTEFRIGSITKQFTAMAILMLQQEGKLNVQDPICRYLHDCPMDWRSITIRDLLTHTSGIPDYLDAVSPGRLSQILSRSWTPAQLTALFRNKPLDFKPGAKFSYSNSGYVLLGRIIERVSGERYGQFLQQHIFGPLGMTRSGYDTRGSAQNRQAMGYHYFDGKYVAGQPVDLTSAFSAGGITSTVRDLYTWDRALAAGKLVSAPLQQQMFARQVPVGGKWARIMGVGGPVYYGFGWFINHEFGRLLYSHEGGLPSFTTINSWFPQQQVYVIVLDNTGSGDIFRIARALAAITFGEKYEVPQPFEAISLPAENLEKFVGSYQAGPKQFLTVTRTGDQLQAQLTGQPAFDIYPESETRFFLKVVRAQLFFQIDPKGDVTGVVLHQNGMQVPAKRLPASEARAAMAFPKTVPVPAAALRKFAGVYRLAPQFAITITVHGDHLVAQGTGQPALPIFPESPTTFFCQGSGCAVHLRRRRPRPHNPAHPPSARTEHARREGQVASLPPTR